MAHIPLFAGIAVAVVIGCYCCYKRRKRSKKDLAAIAEKAGLVILDEQLLRAKEEGRLLVNVSILEAGKVCIMFSRVCIQVSIDRSQSVISYI